MSEDHVSKLLDMMRKVSAATQALDQAQRVKDAYCQRLENALSSRASDAEIAAARDALVDAFAAGLDVYIEQVKLIRILSKK